MIEYLCVLIDAGASLIIGLAALRLYEIYQRDMPFWARCFFASVVSAATYSLFEILAWRQPLPLGMTAFLVLLAVAWAIRAFAPHIAERMAPTAHACKAEPVRPVPFVPDRAHTA